MAHLLSPLHSQICAVVARYLSGDVSLDTGAQELAAIIRAHHETLSRDLRIRELALSDWAHERPSYTSPAVLMDAVRGQSPTDQFKADTLFQQARRLAGIPDGDAA